MIRLEIIANQSIEEDLINLLENNGMGENFSYIYPVFGRGRHGRRESSAVWPEENVIFIVYIEKEQFDPIITELKELKTNFHDEGLRCYVKEDFEKVL